MTRQELQEQLAQKQKSQHSYDLRLLAQQAIDTYPNEGFGYYYLGETEMIDWNWAAAVATFGQALAIEPQSVLYQRRQAKAMIKGGVEVEAGVALYKNLLEQHPDDGELQFEMGYYYMEQWQTELALLHFRLAVALLPDHWEANFNLARTLFVSAMKGAEGLPFAQKAYELHPDSATTDLLILILKQLGDWDGCTKLYQSLITNNPHDSTQYVAYGFFCTEIGDYDKAEEAFSEAIACEERQGYNSPYTFHNRAEMRLKAGRGSAAIEDYNKAIELYDSQYPDSAKDPNLYIRRAQAKEAIDDQAGALSDLLLALQHTPNNQWELQQQIGNIYMEMGEWVQAEQYFKAMQTEGNDWAMGLSMLSLGKLYLAQGKLQAAYDCWQQAKAVHVQEAEGLIAEHCQAILQAERDKGDTELAQAFESFNRANSRSAFMQRLFGKCWQLNPQKTLQYNLEHNPMAMMLPDALRGVLLPLVEDIQPLLRSLYFQFDASKVMIRTSLKGSTVMRSAEQMGNNMGFNMNLDLSKVAQLDAYYKILKETEIMAQIHAQVVPKPHHKQGDDVRILDLLLEGDDELRIDGIGGDRPLTLYFVAKNADQLPDLNAEEQQALMEQLKKRVQEIFLMFMGSMAQGFRNVVQNIRLGNDADDDANGGSSDDK